MAVSTPETTVYGRFLIGSLEFRATDGAAFRYAVERHMHDLWAEAKKSLDPADGELVEIRLKAEVVPNPFADRCETCGNRPVDEASCPNCG